MSQGIKETIEVMVTEFIISMEKAEPFENNLMTFSMKLKSKLLELANLSIYDRDAIENSLILAIQGIENSVDKFLKEADNQDIRLMERTLRFLNEINRIIKEINELGYISDKGLLCRVSSKFDDHILTINGNISVSGKKGILGLLSKLFK